MPDPTRPVDAAEIETEWGQAVHDATFTPKGVHVTSATSRACGTTALKLFIDTAADDPGGWASVATDTVTVPTGAGGVYHLSATVDSQNGTAGTESTRIGVFVNGVSTLGASGVNDGATVVKIGLSQHIELAAADVLEVRASKTGGANVDVTLQHLWLIRRATELGA